MVEKTLKILICGAGSVGIRHANNLLNQGHQVIFYTQRKKLNLKKKLKLYAKLKLAIQKEKPEAAFVTNETSKHILTAIEIAKNKIPLFIEKPLTHKKNGVDNLLKIIKKNNLINMVGYMMRFHPAVKIIKKIIVKNQLGSIFHFYSEWGEYLPDWHKYENYKRSYAANLKKGGGSTLTLSHDLDLIKFLFGEIKFSKTSKYYNGLQINAETASNIFIEFKNKVSGLIHLDYLQRKKSRYLKIIGTKQLLEFFYEKNIIKIYNYKNYKNLIFKGFKRNNMFNDEIKYFLQNVLAQKKCDPDIHCSYKLLSQLRILNN